MIDITARAQAFWLALKMTDAERADLRLKAMIIEAYEQGWMAHPAH